MKKVIAVFICLAICFSIMGCSRVEEKNLEARTVLTSVLNGERNFTFKSLVRDMTTEENVRKFRFSTYSSVRNDFLPCGYMFVDLDSDGIEELIIGELSVSYCLILHCEGERIYGHIVDTIRGVSTDGRFLTQRFANSRSMVCSVTFDGVFCNLTPMAYKDDSAEVYQMNWEDAEKEAVDAYFADWEENTTKMEWINME